MRLELFFNPPNILRYETQGFAFGTSPGMVTRSTNSGRSRIMYRFARLLRTISRGTRDGPIRTPSRLTLSSIAGILSRFSRKSNCTAENLSTIVEDIKGYTNGPSCSTYTHESIGFDRTVYVSVQLCLSTSVTTTGCGYFQYRQFCL